MNKTEDVCPSSSTHNFISTNSNGEKCRIWRTTRNLGPVHVIERPITVHYEDSDKGTVFGEVLLITLALTFFISPEERGDKLKEN